MKKSKCSEAPVDRIVRPAEQSIITGLSKVTIFRAQKAGTFPQNVRVGMHAVGVPLSLLIAWMASRVSVTDAPKAVCVGRKAVGRPKSAGV